jgi:hypothetical protein
MTAQITALAEEQQVEIPTYRYVTDPGHGWLEVPRAELKRLGIEQLISPYSYQKGEFAYLEEDCDYTVFEIEKQNRKEQFKVVRDYQEVTPIRNYESFRV